MFVITIIFNTSLLAVWHHCQAQGVSYVAIRSHYIYRRNTNIVQTLTKICNIITMADKTNQKVVPVSNDWGTKMLEHLKLILDKYMKQFPQYKELISFMEDDKKMYDADGKPSVEYLKLIEDFNKQCTRYPIDIDEIAKEDGLDPTKIEVLKGAKDFLDKQKELMESYRRSSDKENWADLMLDSEEKRDAFEKIVEESTNNALKDYQTILK